MEIDNMCNNMNKKAQFAMEYVLVIAVLFMLLVPGVYLYYTYSQTSLEQISGSRVDEIGNTIINNAENSYFLGRGSKITVEVSMPTGIRGLNINCNENPPSIPTYCELVFVQGGSELVFSTQVPLKRKNYDDGTSGLTVFDAYPHEFDEEDYSGGIKKIVIETKEYAEIDIQ